MSRLIGSRYGPISMHRQRDQIWIWEQPEWPEFRWQDEAVQSLLRRVRLQQGMLAGKASVALEEELAWSRALDTLLDNILSSSAIEGENLDAESVRSSLAKRLQPGIDRVGHTTDRSEGLADLMFDAVERSAEPLDLQRLFQWHAWLFPLSEFTLQDLRPGMLRGEGPMQVVSGRIDRPIVHFEAPPASSLERELGLMIDWFNASAGDPRLDPLLRAAQAHLWFVTIHPFEDGNGRIARALTDMALAQADPQSIYLYTTSASILQHRRSYYEVLEQTQRGALDVTEWMVWFLERLLHALGSAEEAIERTLFGTRFWNRHHESALLPEQVKVLNRLLDGGQRGFEQGISAAQYQKVARVSKATATRHLADLVKKGCLEKLPGGGRSSRYQIPGES